MSESITVHHDVIAEKLDEMADVSEYWKKQRDKGRMPNAIRAAMLMLAEEILQIKAAQERECIEFMDRTCGPTAYHNINGPQQVGKP